jgi:hypothetical protein
MRLNHLAPNLVAVRNIHPAMCCTRAGNTALDAVHVWK